MLSIIIQVGLLFKELDTDGNGDLSQEEFIAEVSERKLKRLRSRLRAASYRDGGQDWQKLFKHYDRDNSGELSARAAAECNRFGV